MSQKESEKEKAYAEIMYMFRYLYKDEWSPENIFEGKTRLWIQTFNRLIEQGFIERKKSEFGYKYRWKAEFPEHY